jgi:hypothetical protein
LNSKIKSIISIGFIILVLAGFFLRYLTYDAAYINDWVTRDFDRAFNLVEGVYFPLAGSEMNNGGRLPGPFLYLLLSIPILIKHSYESIIAFNFILNCASVIGLFFVARKFFGFYVGLLSSIFLSFNLTHIGAAGFPFNPSYIFLLIPLYLWFIFELGINRNIKFLPLIILIISLGIQLHFSLATFYIVPVLLIILLRIKVTLKPVILSVVLAAICFTPYSIYLKQTFNPMLGDSVTFEAPNFSIVERIIKFPILGNTLEHLTFKNGLKRGFYFDRKIAIIYCALTLISFLFLIWRIYKIKKEKGFQVSNKEFSLFLVFYAPALIYEIISPVGHSPNPHNWYFFIFIMPQMIMISYFIVFFLQKLKTNWQKGFYTLAIFGLIIFIAIDAYADVRRSSANLKKELFSGEFNNYKKLHSTLMQTLKLTSGEYTSRVYFEGFPPNSLKAIKLIKPSNKDINDIQLINLKEFQLFDNQIYRHKNYEKEFSCFFMISGDENLKSKNTGPINFISYRLKKFIRDKNIKRYKSTLKILFKKNMQTILVAKYNSQKKSCYSNGLNRFVAEKDIRDLLIDTKNLDTEKDLDMKVVLKETNYGSTNEMNSFQGEYLVFEKFTSSPFKLNLKIKKSDKGYIINIDILRYYYLPFHEYVDKMELAICNSQFQTRLNKKNCIFITIIPKDTLASTIFSYNQEWQKTISLPKGIKIEKNKHFLKLAWSSKKIANIDQNGLYFQNENTSVISLN